MALTHTLFLHVLLFAVPNTQAWTILSPLSSTPYSPSSLPTTTQQNRRSAHPSRRIISDASLLVLFSVSPEDSSKGDINHDYFASEQQQKENSKLSAINHSNMNQQTPHKSVQDDWDSSTRGKNVTAYYEKQMHILNARAKIDRILKGPDPPLDMEAELKKVRYVAPPSPQSHLHDPADVRAEERIMQLEADIQSSIQREQYSKAAKAKQEIGELHVDDCGAVLQVNARYYQAFSNKHYADMAALWLQDGTAICIHPSQRPLIGSKAVLASWRKMFASTAGAFQKSILEPHHIHVSVKGATTAVVTCDEHVYARRFVRGQKRETVLVNKLTATNIFRKVQGRWYLTHHHASWHAQSPAAQNALKGGKVGGGGIPSSGGRLPGSIASRSNMLPVFDDDDDEEDDFDDFRTDRDMPEDWSNSNNFPDEKDSKNGNDEERKGSDTIDGILGIPNYGPLLGEGEKKEPKKQVRSIAMGSLNDLLGGGLGDILGNGPGAGSSGVGPDGPISNDKPIIRIARINGREITGGGARGRSAADDLGLDDEILDDFDDDDMDSTQSRANVRQKCIQLLRQLNKSGALSPRQKRVLLTDIISQSTKGETSMVETAYELLCHGNDDDEDKDDTAQEEFADQCRVIAASLLENSDSA